MELWRTIKNYPKYMVSSLGKVKSFWHGKEKIIKPCKGPYGYLHVGLTNEYGHKTYRINRLVAEAFLPNENNYPIVNHKNENITDNTVFINEDDTIDFEKSNLEWCTYKYNSNYGSRNKKISDKLKNGSCSKVIKQYTLDGEFIREWPSLMEIKRILGLSPSVIQKCCSNKYCNKTYKGYIWKY